MGYPVKKYPPVSAGTMGPGGRAGFTLLEIMVSMALVAIVLVSVFKMHAATISMAERSRFMAVAGSLARAKTVMFSSGMASGREESGDFGEGFSGYSWERRLHPLALRDVDGTDSREIEKLTCIDLTVTCQGRHTLSLRTWRYDPAVP